MGFSRDTATTLVHHTLLGSTKFAMETGEHPGEMNITFFFLLSISSLGEEFSLIASLIVAATTNTRSGIEE
jgi:pyrroline-5-carboxylate reductase